MSNGARHTWGVLAGVVLTAALAGLLIFGTYRLQHGYVMQFHKTDKWIGGGLIAGAAVVFALLAASRLSPLGSLIGGLVLAGAGALFFVSQKTTAELINRFPFRAERVTLAGLEEEGFILFAGVGLIVASLFPSRWRANRGEAGAGYEYGLPDDADPYGERTRETATGGRHTVRDEPAYEAQQTNYDAPLYEPREQSYEQQYGHQYERPYEQPYDQPYARRSPFIPPDESDGTREMRRE